MFDMFGVAHMLLVTTTFAPVLAFVCGVCVWCVCVWCVSGV